MPLHLSRPAVRVLGLMALLMLAGCGSTGTTVDAGKQLQDLKVKQPAPTQSQFDPQAFTRQVMGEVAEAQKRTKTLSFDITGYFVSLDTNQPGSNKVHFDFECPSKTAISVLQSTDGRTVGTKLVWLGGAKMTVHTKFIGFWITADVDVHDPRATDQRGYFLDETSIPANIATFLDARNQVKFLGMGSLGSEQVAQFDVISPRRLRGVSHEVFTIDAQRKLPVVREMYDAQNKLVFRIRMENIQLNPSLAPTTFTVK